MASIAAIAGIRDDATKRLLAAAAVISQQTGVDSPVFEAFRQPDYHQAMQLKTLADWVEKLAVWIDPPAPDEEPDLIAESEESPELPEIEAEQEPSESAYADMTVAELTDLAEQRGVPLTKRIKKADIINALESFSLGVSAESENDEE